MDEAHKEIWKAIEEINKFNAEEAYRNAKDRQDIKMLKDYLELKENNIRNDYDILVVKLRNEVMKRPRGMTTRDVKNHFRLKHGKQAIRLMERTAKEFTLDIMLHLERGKRKSWRIKARRAA